MNEKMSLNEIKWNEDVLEARKLKKEKERWKEEDEWKRIICIFNICEKLKKPHDLNLTCPRCDREALKMFSATSNVFIPPYFMTMKSDIYDYDDWRKLKKNPNIERAR